MARSDAANYPPDRPLVILMNGPLHRRIYWADDLPRRIPYRDAGRFTTRPLGEIYAVGVPTPLRDRLPAVWEWTGTVEPSLAARATPTGGFARSCNYLHCLTPAAKRIDGETGRPLYGCPEHAEGSAKSMSGGQRVDYRVTVTPI